MFGYQSGSAACVTNPLSCCIHIKPPDFHLTLTFCETHKSNAGANFCRLNYDSATLVNHSDKRFREHREINSLYLLSNVS